MSKVVILGIDGASLKLIEQWQDELPNLKKIMENGVYSEMESTIPPVTCPAWPAMFTGKNPGKLGMYHFTNFLPRQGYNFRIHSSADWHSSSLWKILNDYGKEVGLLNIPMTFPAHRVDTFVVAGSVGLPIDRKSAATYPLNLKEELDKAVGGYRTFNTVAYPSPGKEDAYIRRMEEMLDMRLKAARYLIDRFPWDLFIFVFTVLDQIQHFFWRHMDESHPQHRPNKYQGVIKDFYRKVDRAIGELVGVLPAETNILLTSDHGFGGRHGGFLINKWLENNGFLTLKSKPHESWLNRGLYGLKEFLLQHLPQGLVRFIVRISPWWLLKKLSVRAKEKFDVAEIYKNIDWSRTKAYGVAEVGIYINLKGRDAGGIIEAEDYDDIRNDIIEKLSAIADPRTGKPLAPQIFKKEQVYHGEHLDSAPDIAFLMPPYGIHAAVVEKAEWTGLSDQEKLELSGWHRLEGVFMACGPDVRRTGEKLPNLKIYDIAPTVLHMFGLPVTKDMDGRVLSEIFEPDSEIARRPVVYQSATERDRVKGRVRKLKDSGKI